MAVPKKKKSKSMCGHKNSHTALKSVALSFDQNGEMQIRHRATKVANGSITYKGKVVAQSKVKAEEASSS